MEFALIWLLLSLVVGAYSRSKGHSFIAGFFFAVLLSPLIAGLIVAVRAPNKATIEAREVSSGAMKKCPACAELVRAEATKCRHCGEVFPSATTARQCSRCNSINVGSGKRCGECGEPLGVAPYREDDPASGFGG